MKLKSLKNGMARFLPWMNTAKSSGEEMIQVPKKQEPQEIKEITAPENIENLEKELKKEYGIEDAVEKQPDIPAINVDKIAEDIKEATTIEEVTPEAIEEKIDKLEKMEDELEKKIKKLQQKAAKIASYDFYGF